MHSLVQVQNILQSKQAIYTREDFLRNIQFAEAFWEKQSPKENLKTKTTAEFLPHVQMGYFLGGLSLHLNHLIALCMTNYDWPFGTLPFGLFGSNLDTRDLETYPRICSGHF